MATPKSMGAPGPHLRLDVGVTLTSPTQMVGIHCTAAPSPPGAWGTGGAGAICLPSADLQGSRWEQLENQRPSVSCRITGSIGGGSRGKVG